MISFKQIFRFSGSKRAQKFGCNTRYGHLVLLACVLHNGGSLWCTSGHTQGLLRVGCSHLSNTHTISRSLEPDVPLHAQHRSLLSIQPSLLPVCAFPNIIVSVYEGWQTGNFHICSLTYSRRMPSTLVWKPSVTNSFEWTSVAFTWHALSWRVHILSPSRC